MARGEKIKFDKYQINLTIPKEWKNKLEHEARVKACQEERNISVVTLIREVLAEKFNLKLD